jgi:SAM-dependent methyltransferase
MLPSRNFDRVAHLYDDTRRTPQLVRERGFPAILAAAGPGARILDVGTGTGRLAVPLLALGADLIGLDLSWEMMARWRAKTAAARLVQGSALALPFGDGRFDALLTAHVLHLIADWQAALVEFRRVLRSGGVYINARTESESTDESPYRRVAAYWSEWLAARGGLPHGLHVGVWDQSLVTPELVALGATVNTVDAAHFTERYALRERVEGYRNRSYSSTWEVPDDLLAASVDATEAWITAEYGGLDVEIEEPVVFRLHVARFD